MDLSARALTTLATAAPYSGGTPPLPSLVAMDSCPISSSSLEDLTPIALSSLGGGISRAVNAPLLMHPLQLPLPRFSPARQLVRRSSTASGESPPFLANKIQLTMTTRGWHPSLDMQMSEDARISPGSAIFWFLSQAFGTNAALRSSAGLRVHTNSLSL